MSESDLESDTESVILEDEDIETLNEIVNKTKRFDALTEELDSTDKDIWQKLVEGYEEGNPETYEDSLLHRVMDSIIDCSTTNFANEAAFNKWKTKTSIDLSWNYFKDIWKKLYLNKNKGGDLWDLAVNGELTKNQIKVGKNPRSSGGNRNSQNNNQANDQPPPNEIIMPNDPHQLFHLLYVKYKKDGKLEDDMDVKDFIMQWRYKLSNKLGW